MYEAIVTLVFPAKAGESAYTRVIRMEWDTKEAMEHWVDVRERCLVSAQEMTMARRP